MLKTTSVAKGSMMDNTRQQIEAFFQEYADRLNRALSNPPEVDVDATADAFAECFIEASPKGVSCGKNDEQFRIQIPKGLAFYHSIGTQSMNILSTAITQLDDFHWQVKAHWEAAYQKQDGTRDVIPFDVLYFLQLLNSKLKIFAYITGDEEQMYKDHGLV
jgi:hypothetical protein